MEEKRVTSRADRDRVPDADRDLRRRAARDDGGQPACARRCRRARPRARAGRVRGPLHGIPIALKDNIHTTDMPTTGGALAFAGLRAAVRSDAHHESEGRRRHHHRQDRHDRARQLGGRRADADADQLQRRRRLRLQPLRSAARSRDADCRRPAGARHGRIELRHRHGRELLGGQRRHRNLRLDSEPGEPEHARGHQADGRPHQPLRRDSDHGRSGHAGPDGEDGHATRRSCSARSKGAAPDPNDPGDARVHAAAGSRLHAVPARRAR